MASKRNVGRSGEIDVDASITIVVMKLKHGRHRDNRYYKICDNGA